jgi:hypothetical protein
VLQGMQTQHCVSGSITAAENTKDAAFFVKLVTVGRRMGKWMCGQVQGSVLCGHTAAVIDMVYIMIVWGALGQLSVRFWMRRFISSREPDV